MFSDRQLERLLSKLRKFENVLSGRIFIKKDELTVGMFETMEPLDAIPEDALFSECKSGTHWGGDTSYCWFKGVYEVPEELNGQKLYIYPKLEGYEGMLWVDGMPRGTFCTKIVVTGHGNHYCDMLVEKAAAGQKLDVALECYSGHYVAGCDPWGKDPERNYNYTFSSVDICVKDEQISDFYFDLRTLNQLVATLPQDSFRRADVIRTLMKVHEILYYSPEDVEEEVFRGAIEEAAPLLKEQLAKKNSETVPFAGLIGHSHMDTAWLWHMDETVKKCARTYSNELNLMDQYPEYKFIQSSAYHGKMILEHYPQLFEQIAKRVAEGRYEPNGGVWIECDCNITSGESMVRQFLWGQRFTKKHFGYMSNSFWLPDTFGYSASIPQIMKGCGIDYFLTTKMSWNDTTQFPYDTFYWKGIDGTRVLTHFNVTHMWPDTETVNEHVVKGGNCIREKSVSDMRLLSYGFGDGGGGPQFEMIEMARRIKDLEGIPKSEHVLVGDFMKRLEESIEMPSEHCGELYLELHRGTLTNQHTIKRNNRTAEKRLRDLEILTVEEAVKEGKEADSAEIAPLMETLLVNQFHDILPGTCIPRAHKESIEQTTELIKCAEEKISRLLSGKEGADCRTLVNTLSFEREDIVYLEDVDGRQLAGGYTQQLITDMKGKKKLAIAGLKLAPLARTVVTLEPGTPESPSAFVREGNVLRTKNAVITFDDKMYISSYYDTVARRELRGEGYALNTFLVAEDMPDYWDNWDIDADIEMKFRDSAALLSSEVVADGAVEYRIRNRYRLTEKSELTQDMIFYADRPGVYFETKMDWQDNHRFLKTAFDVSVHTDFARQEIQFGYLRRATTRNTAAEKARFEVCNHKYTDLSETGYGVSIFNDCKYGISVKDSQMRLSLHKGGCRPDYNGDRGVHECAYAFFPHEEGFSAKAVIQPAYTFNYPVLTENGADERSSFAAVGCDNVLIEAIKPCEDTQRGFVMRLYEAEGTYANAVLSVPQEVKKVYAANMLEDISEELALENGKVEIAFRAFEIKTLVLVY